MGNAPSLRSQKFGANHIPGPAAGVFSNQAGAGKRRRRGPLADWIRVLRQTEQAEEEAHKDAEALMRKQLIELDALTLRFTRSAS